jgi:2-iminobutanoate/2-iminopropanoate deaminase
MMARELISTDKAPRAVGPYSQAVRAGGFVFVSGQIPLDPGTGELLKGPVSEQAGMVLKALGSILDAAGSSLEKVVKVNIYLTSMDDFAEVNRVYGKFFGGDCPARCAVEVSALPKGASIELEATALA